MALSGSCGPSAAAGAAVNNSVKVIARIGRCILPPLWPGIKPNTGSLRSFLLPSAPVRLLIRPTFVVWPRTGLDRTAAGKSSRRLPQRPPPAYPVPCLMAQLHRQHRLCRYAEPMGHARMPRAIICISLHIQNPACSYPTTCSHHQLFSFSYR